MKFLYRVKPEVISAALIAAIIGLAVALLIIEPWLLVALVLATAVGLLVGLVWKEATYVISRWQRSRISRENLKDIEYDPQRYWK